MVVCDAKECHTLNRHTPILQKVHVVRQISYAISIPQAEVMIACHKYFVGIGLINEPDEKIKHLPLCPIVSKVATMHNHIGFWHVCQ